MRYERRLLRLLPCSEETKYLLAKVRYGCNMGGEVDPSKIDGMDICPEEFVMLWQASESVAEKSGLPSALVHARTTRYRRRGCRLKRILEERQIFLGFT